jgi:hypothetical protein
MATIDIFSREQWRARPYRGRAQGGREPIKELASSCRGWAVHYNGPPMETKDQADEIRKVRAIQNFHMDAKGWSDIAYSVMIGQSGTIYEGRGWDWDQFANGDDEVAPFAEHGTKGWRSVCWLGGVGQEPSSAVIRVLTMLIHYSRVEKGMGLEVHPHLDWQPKPCPGPRLTQLCRTLNNWPIPLGPLEPAPQPPAPQPGLPSTQEDDMLTAIRAKGHGEIYLTDGWHRWYVANGDDFAQACWIKSIRYDGVDQHNNYVPFEVSAEFVERLVPGA